ncbi:MAG: HAMP domain-containing histidine kinase [Bacteroidales bacterium]|nr:HAMP domain-containing histidine kinase [Bacteroidales bacterium]
MTDFTTMSNERLLAEIKSRLKEKELYQNQVNKLNSTILELGKKLNESESLKTHFISNISNELMNPFTSILAISENILSVDKENWKKVIHMVSLIHTEVFNLDFQLKNIFAAAKIEAGETQPEITLINIDQLISNLIQSFKHESKVKHLKVDYLSRNLVSDTVLYFKSDAEKVQLLLSNLLSNAIKFSYPEGNVQIEAIKDEETLTIKVKDEGQGISKSNEQIIYDRFKRLDSGINSLNRGHGLGLSIMKAICDILNGKLSFESELGKGTTFTLQLKESTGDTTGISTDADEIFFKEDIF